MRPPLHIPEPAMMTAPLLMQLMAFESADSRVKFKSGR
jgi:hypothetical protein